MASTSARQNRLAGEKSPYLLQHAGNPVDWYPWGEEAFARARAEDKPVFLSIGYATCHWCHVMERESFESQEVAAFLNQRFVSIKVDREERPDVDEIYMGAVQAMTGSGGWPLSLFLAPDGRPFYGGTYFPMPRKFGRPSFLDLLQALDEAWRNKREKVLDDARWMHEHLQAQGREGEPAALGEELLRTGFEQLRERHDDERGGFGGQMKFPTPHNLTFLLRWDARAGAPEARRIVTTTLDAMAEGGLRDHLGGGFHRYAVDPEWEIPHFEKMLYDQAGLVRAYVEGWQVMRHARWAEVARETCEFVLREMRAPGGAFTSAWDADSEGVEGKFYVWTQAELREALGADFPAFAALYRVSEGGNFHELPGANHLQLRQPLADAARQVGTSEAELLARVARCQATLLALRARRVPPLHDDKVLADWNGLMIGALALAGRALGEPRYVQAAEEAATFVLETLRALDGGLLHRWRDGEAAIPALLDDHAYLAHGLLELFQATGRARWLSEARRLAAALRERFADAERGGFFQTPSDTTLITRSKPGYDGALPSGNAVAAEVLLRLGRLLPDEALLEEGRRALSALSQTLARAPGLAATWALAALDVALGPAREVVLAGPPDEPDFQALARAVDERFLPRAALVRRGAEAEPALLEALPWVAAQGARDGRPTAWVCQDHACQRPVHDPAALGALLDQTAGRAGQGRA